MHSARIICLFMPRKIEFGQWLCKCNIAVWKKNNKWCHCLSSPVIVWFICVRPLKQATKPKDNWINDQSCRFWECLSSVSIAYFIRYLEYVSSCLSVYVLVGLVFSVLPLLDNKSCKDNIQSYPTLAYKLKHTTPLLFYQWHIIAWERCQPQLAKTNIGNKFIISIQFRLQAKKKSAAQSEF